MLDERALVMRLEAADADEMARMFVLAKGQEEKVLRAYLGDDRFRCFRNLALRRELRRNESRGSVKGNVVIIPGVLGSELTSRDAAGNRERIWLNPRRIVAGDLGRLRLGNDGLIEHDAEFKIEASGVLKRYYGQLILGLSESWNVHAFAYDWRKDLRLVAAQLQAYVNSWFPENACVHFVAHGEGGLVARACIANYPSLWKNGGRLIMLGTPNYGTYAAPQAITGHLDVIRQTDLLDARHDRTAFRTIVKSFPSTYQLLPSPEIAESPELGLLYESATYGVQAKVPQSFLNAARDFHSLLDHAEIDFERMIYLGGDGRPTWVLNDIESIGDFSLDDSSIGADRAYLERVYRQTRNGDGKVPHQLGVLRSGNDHVPAFCVEGLGSALVTNPQVLIAIEELLDTGDRISLHDYAFVGKLRRLSGMQPISPEMLQSNGDSGDSTATHNVVPGDLEYAKCRQRMESLVRRITIRRDEPVDRDYVSAEEREIDQLLTRGFMKVTEPGRAMADGNGLVPPTIKLCLALGELTTTHLQKQCPMRDVFEAVQADAVALGHYVGNKPHGTLRSLDRKISQWMRKVAQEGAGQEDGGGDREAVGVDASSDRSQSELDEASLLLTQFTQRGTLRAELAVPFLLPDPRVPSRTIAIAGMGEPGRFGVPELTLLTRELCWTLGKLQKRHVAALLIGSGRGNLDVASAVSGWIRGIKLAISGACSDESPFALDKITFFMRDPWKLLQADEAIQAEADSLRKSNRMNLCYTKFTEEERLALGVAARKYASDQMLHQFQQASAGDGLHSPAESEEEPAPTRITVALHGSTYRFGAITNTASIPEREIPLDPKLVTCANDELAAAPSIGRQLQLGQFLQRLLIPEDLRPQLMGSAPLVMMLDRTTARIHWELLAHAEVPSAASRSRDAPKVVDDESQRMQFLGICRGFTRQLRTLFAPPPDPPPPSKRLLRVLVVADPAEDAHLEGAEEEGIEVGDLFEQFNVLRSGSGNRVEVVRLLGPREATRTAVLRQLMMRTYDVLHFAGHCMYDKENPPSSGWIFSNGERLSAYEITRIDRSPALVVSNACESGITPARCDERSVELAPSFAEAFFGRGVTNFVCTAWPVDDRAARTFALSLYANLLGIPLGDPNRSESTTRHLAIGTPLPMYKAMQAARISIADATHDVRTWGAYQHYGNPYSRLFDPRGMTNHCYE